MELPDFPTLELTCAIAEHQQGMLDNIRALVEEKRNKYPNTDDNGIVTVAEIMEALRCGM
jgi:hypothetical protein